MKRFSYCHCRKGSQRAANCSKDRAKGLPCRTSGKYQAVRFVGHAIRKMVSDELAVLRYRVTVDG